jgi:hypothetical protein
MNDDVRRVTYWTILLFLAIVAAWLGFVYVSACGLTLTCERAAPVVERTPIPTLAPATLPARDTSRRTEFNKCQVAAVDLIGAWVSAGYPESGGFQFTGADGSTCEGTFPEDVQPLFVNSNLWYAGALACSSCHNAALLTSNGGLDLSSYEGMRLGTRRPDLSETGDDLFAAGDWEGSVLYDWLFLRKHIPLARPPELAAGGPVIFAGVQLSGPAADATPAAP